MSDNPSIVSSDQGSSTQIGYEHHLEIGLYKTGLKLSLQNSDRSHFLDFDDLSVTADYAPQGKQLSTLNSLGLIGFVDLGPGYLIVIHTQVPVFEHKDVTIWNIMKSLLIPLKFDLTKGYFKIEEGLLEEDDEENSETNDKENVNENQEEVEVSGIVGDRLNQTKDMFFSKLGVYVNDLKSNPSLSISNKIVNLLDTENENESDEIDARVFNSVRVKRSITIRGMPKEIAPEKSNNFTRLFDKIKQQQLDQKEQRYTVSNSMLYKFEKQIQNFFSSKDFFYSREIDLTKNLVYENGALKTRSKTSASNSFHFNNSLSKKFQDTDLTLSLIQGFVGSIDIDLNLQGSLSSRQGKLLLVSKRSTKRAGSRYLRRGIDDHANVANFVSTSQILITELNKGLLFAKFDIIRGSIPLFFQQNPANLKPIPTLTRSIEKCSKPFKQHFENLLEKYGSVSCISLVERTNREQEIGEAYEKLAKDNNIEFSWFDFHEICKKMKFDNVSQLLDYPIDNNESNLTVKDQIMNYGWYDNVTNEDQLGIFRVNCIDCLDRTNIVSKYISETVLLQQILPQHELSIDNVIQFQKQYNNLWADNGDYISRQYASTNALKGDYTRTAKRNYKGLLNDAFLTMSRYYSGYISDYFKQCVVDYLLGHKNHEIFEEFESTLNVLDPNEINENLNKKNSSLKLIIEELGILKSKNDDDEDDDDGGSGCDEDEESLILVGSWSGIESPMELNTLKLKQLSNSGNKTHEISLIVTNKVLFFVKFNEKESKIDKTIKVRVSDVKELQYGVYITSTHSSLSINPKKNIGLKFIMNPNFEQHDEIEPLDDYLVIKFPQDMDYEKVKYIIELIFKTCHSSTLSNVDLMNEEDAKKNVNIIQNLEYKFKKLVWG